MTSHPVRIGLVGCGRLAELGYIPALARVHGAQLVAVADPDPIRRDRAAAIAATVGEPVAMCTDANTLLERVAPDAVVLATPAPTHLADAGAAATAGVAVLVEKPPALDAAGAAALAALTPPPWVGFNRRYDPGAQRVRAAIPADGDVDLRLEISYRRRSWRAHSVVDDALLDLGPHLLDWARWLTRSEVTAVSAAEVGANCAVVTVFLGRGRATIVANTDRLHHEVITVRALAGARLARHSVGGPVAAVLRRFASGPHPLVNTLVAQLDDFAGAVRGQSPNELGTASDGLAVMSAIDAARASIADGGRVVPVPRSVKA